MSGTVHQEEEAIVGRVYDARLMRRLLAYAAPYRAALITSATLLLVASGLEVIPPYLVKVAIDSHILPGELHGLWGLALLYLAIVGGAMLLAMPVAGGPERQIAPTTAWRYHR